MELDELKQAWAQYDEKLSTHLKLNEELLKSINFEKLSHALRKPLNLELLNVVIQFFAVLMVVVFTIRLMNETPYLLAGTISALVCASSLILSSVKASLFHRLLNYHESITGFQTGFARLKILIARLRKIEFVLAGLIGITLFPLMIKAVADVDLLGNLTIIIPGILLVMGTGYAIGSWLNIFIYDKGLEDAERFLGIIKEFGEEARQ
jgi:hypothetical protein